MANPATDTNEWVTVKELAAELRVSPSLVYRAVADGRLPVFRLSETGSIRIRRAVLDRARKEQL